MNKNKNEQKSPVLQICFYLTLVPCFLYSASRTYWIMPDALAAGVGGALVPLIAYWIAKKVGKNIKIGYIAGIIVGVLSVLGQVNICEFPPKVTLSQPVL